MKLSPNLTLAEVIKSQTAIRKGIDNTPTEEHLVALMAIARDVFQPVRDHFATPIAVTSGYRSPELNKAIKGSKTSQHTKGEALDLDADVFGGLTNKELFDYIREHLTYDQLIYEFSNPDGTPAWVHVSYKADGPNRMEVLKAEKKGGRTIYTKLS